MCRRFPTAASMAVHLEDYQDILDELGGHAVEVLRSSWIEAARAFSPKGLEVYYLKGAQGLKSVGRGSDTVVSFLEAAPAVAREIGEEAVKEMLTAAMKMASRTSAAVLALFFSTAPVAAQRLGDAELFRGYLNLVDLLLAQAPRGVRPLLDHLDALLGQLTLGGLRRWAMWGAHAHKTDPDAQVRYFSLESPESLKVLQKERRGTLFVDVQRRLNMYLRALWARDFFMRPTSGDYESRAGYRPYIDGFFIHLPDAFDAVPGELSRDGAPVSGLEIYRAAAAHVAAHVVHTRAQFEDLQYGLLQCTLIGLIEDARVEALAIKKFPGLAHLWWRLHTTGPADGDAAPALFARLARALLDPDYADPHPWVVRAQTDFYEAAERWDDPELARELGLRLAGEHARQQLPFAPSDDALGPAYRDDNRYLWEFEDFLASHDVETLHMPQQVRRKVSLMEMVNEVDNELADDTAQEIWVLPTEFFRDSDARSMNELEGKEPVSAPCHYHEWDYQMQLERPSWVTLLEKRPKRGDPERIEEIIAKHRPIVSRLKFLIDAMQPQGVKRLRKQEDGDEIDLTAAVDALIDARLGRHPEPRIMIRNIRKVRDLALLLLIDLSESTNETVAGRDFTVLDLAREAAALLSHAMDKVGDRFAIHGFDSNGRHDVEYYRYKDFDTAYDDEVKGRLAGMTGQLSTRMGTAIRHAGRILAETGSARKLLLIITDGEPADNDVRDPQYLRFDTKKAVEEIAKAGVSTFCMTLDPHADQYVARIFGARNYMIVDHVERLPEKLPLLYAGLTR